jgi:hypothetical protein
MLPHYLIPIWYKASEMVRLRLRGSQSPTTTIEPAGWLAVGTLDVSAGRGQQQGPLPQPVRGAPVRANGVAAFGGFPLGCRSCGAW